MRFNLIDTETSKAHFHLVQRLFSSAGTNPMLATICTLEGGNGDREIPNRDQDRDRDSLCPCRYNFTFLARRRLSLADSDVEIDAAAVCNGGGAGGKGGKRQIQAWSQAQAVAKAGRRRIRGDYGGASDLRIIPLFSPDPPKANTNTAPV